MAFSTSSLRFFQTIHKNGFSPDNKFQFIITPPPALSQTIATFAPSLSPVITSIMNRGIGELLGFSCKKVTRPSSAFNIHQHHLNGKQYHTPLNRDYDSIKAEFYLDAHHMIHHFFEMWQDYIHNPATQKRGYYENYVSPESHLFCFDEQHDLYSPAQDYIFTNMWPSEIHEIEYDAESQDRWQILPITFVIERYDTAMALDLQGQIGGAVSRTLRSIISGGGPF